MSCKNKLWRITLDTNPELCNYHCIMCEEHSEFAPKRNENRIMPTEWLEKIFSSAKKLGVSQVIPSTMGEPLLYSGIEEFFYLAKKYGLKVNLTTNGSFPKKSIDEWSEIIVPQTSDVKISINGAKKSTSENIMKGSDFDVQIQNIKSLVNYRNEYFSKTGDYCSVTLQLTFMTINMQELPDIVKMAASMDVDRIKGHHLWVNFDEIKNFSFKRTEESRALWNKYVKEAFVVQEKFLRPNGEKVKLENFEMLDVFSEKAKGAGNESACPFLGRELWISATGKISPCCAPDCLRKSLGDFGNIQSTTLESVLQSDAYQKLCENYKTFDVCKNCNMRRKIKEREL